LDVFLKGEDRIGWLVESKLPTINLVLRKGDDAHNDAAAEQVLCRRTETEWPRARTKYIIYCLAPETSLTSTKPSTSTLRRMPYPSLGTLEKPRLVQFVTSPMESEIEITGHILPHLIASVTPSTLGISPSDIGLFITLTHISIEGKEVFCTSTVSDPVPVVRANQELACRGSE